jgi:signal transduction histidine kinase
MVQTGQPAEVRRDRIAPVTGQLRRTFEALHADTEAAVEKARDIGLDEQSRYATQSLGLARMQAMLENTVAGLDGETEDQAELRAYIDGFATSFDPLLGQAVNAEVLFRNAILQGIDTLRRKLAITALAIAGATVLLVAAFYLGLVRPQFARIDRLREAAQQIGREEFGIRLPVTRMDEIGQLATETQRMADALSERKREVQSEWGRLNETIAQRTEELRAANATLEEIDANRRRFFADVSHELRTPLTVILMEAQIGRQSLPEAAAAFATIEARAARLNRRIDDLLRVARSDSGQLELDVQPTPLPELIAQVVEEIRAETDSAGLVLTVDDMPKVRLQCDPNWVRQVLVGIIRNAIRHARDGGALRLTAEDGDGRVTLRVIDHGPGIPPDQLPCIFDRFTQGGGAGKTQGFGLGLALAHWVVEAQGGSITAQSPLPDADRPKGVTGTAIAVCLPRADD